MAVVNTITIAKSGGSFTSVDEIKGAFLTALDDAAYAEDMAKEISKLTGLPFVLSLIHI